MRLVWTTRALRDRDRIYSYIENDDPAAALSLDEHFEKRTSQLVVHPALGRIGRVEKTRELVVHPNYIIIYDLVGNDIRVLRILHARQQWPANS